MAFVELSSWRTTLKHLAYNIVDKAGLVGHATTMAVDQTWPRRDSARQYANNVGSSILRNTNRKQFNVPLDYTRNLLAYEVSRPEHNILTQKRVKVR